MNIIGLAVENWDVLAADRERWKSFCGTSLEEGERKIRMKAIGKRERRKVDKVVPQTSDFVCPS